MKTPLTFFLLILCSIVNGQSPQVKKLSKLYMSGKLEQTIIKAEKYLKNDGNNIDYKLILGRALTDIGEYNKAIPNLQFAIDNDQSWRKAWGLGYIGSCYFMLSEYEQSETALTSCIELNATKNATNYSYKKSLLFGYNSFFKEWKIKESNNIRFHFQDMSDSKVELYMKSREGAYMEVNKFFGSVLPKKIDFFVWDSKKDAKEILHTNLGFAYPQYCIVHSHVKQTEGHELTHVISHYSNKIVKKTGLINEGTAVCFDLSKMNREEMVLNWLKVNNQKINIIDIWGNWKKYSPELTYPLSGLFVKELIDNFGKEKFLSFFKNQTYKNAISVFGNDIDVLIKEFENKYNE